MFQDQKGLRRPASLPHWAIFGDPWQCVTASVPSSKIFGALIMATRGWSLRDAKHRSECRGTNAFGIVKELSPQSWRRKLSNSGHSLDSSILPRNSNFHAGQNGTTFEHVRNLRTHGHDEMYEIIYESCGKIYWNIFKQCDTIDTSWSCSSLSCAATQWLVALAGSPRPIESAEMDEVETLKMDSAELWAFLRIWQMVYILMFIDGLLYVYYWKKVYWWLLAATSAIYYSKIWSNWLPCSTQKPAGQTESLRSKLRKLYVTIEDQGHVLHKLAVITQTKQTQEPNRRISPQNLSHPSTLDVPTVLSSPSYLCYENGSQKCHNRATNRPPASASGKWLSRRPLAPPASKAAAMRRNIGSLCSSASMFCWTKFASFFSWAHFLAN